MSEVPLYGGMVPEGASDLLGRVADPVPREDRHTCQREFFIDNLLVRIHFGIVMIRRTGLAPWEFEFPFPGSLTSATPQPSARQLPPATSSELYRGIRKGSFPSVRLLRAGSRACR